MHARPAKMFGNMSLKSRKSIVILNKVIHTFPTFFPHEMRGPRPAVADLSPTSERSNSQGFSSTLFLNYNFYKQIDFEKLWEYLDFLQSYQRKVIGILICSSKNTRIIKRVTHPSTNRVQWCCTFMIVFVDMPSMSNSIKHAMWDCKTVKKKQIEYYYFLLPFFLPNRFCIYILLF